MRAAELADELGYEAVQVPEGWGLDATVLLSQLVPRTRRITLVTSVLSIWGRTPATLAMGAATLHAMSGGRHVVGLGASSPALAEGFHDRIFERPADKLREVATAARRSPTAAPPGCRGNGSCRRPRRWPTSGSPPVSAAHR